MGRRVIASGIANDLAIAAFGPAMTFEDCTASYAARLRASFSSFRMASVSGRSLSQ